MINIAICDDDEFDRNEIEEYCMQYKNGHEEIFDIKSYSLGTELLVDDYRADILLLDKDMPELNGIDIKERLMEQQDNVYIIFVTGYDLIPEMVGTNVSGYLRKPVEYTKLEKEIDKILRTRFQNERAIVLQDVKGNKVVRIKDIVYGEVDKPYIVLNMVDGTRLLERRSLVQFVNELQDTAIHQAGRRYLVNLAHIKEISQNVVLDTGEQIKISKAAKSELKKLYNAYILKRKRERWR